MFLRLFLKKLIVLFWIYKRKFYSFWALIFSFLLCPPKIIIMQICHIFETVTTLGSETEKCISILAIFAEKSRRKKLFLTSRLFINRVQGVDYRLTAKAESYICTFIAEKTIFIKMSIIFKINKRREMKKFLKENLSTIVEVLSILVSLIGLFIQ